MFVSIDIGMFVSFSLPFSSFHHCSSSFFLSLPKKPSGFHLSSLYKVGTTTITALLLANADALSTTLRPPQFLDFANQFHNFVLFLSRFYFLFLSRSILQSVGFPGGRPCGLPKPFFCCFISFFLEMMAEETIDSHKNNSEKNMYTDPETPCAINRSCHFFIDSDLYAGAFISYIFHQKPLLFFI